jgi:hypothetical protein
VYGACSDVDEHNQWEFVDKYGVASVEDATA